MGDADGGWFGGDGSIFELSGWDIVVLVIFAYFIWNKVISPRLFGREDRFPKPEPQLPPLKKQDFTLEQLRPYDGTGEDGRILMACDGKVFDVTRGKRFYGKDGPYGVFAGRDASRGMATFCANEESLRDEHDDLADLDEADKEQMKEWAESFSEKYDVVGKLLKPGEEATIYSEEEEEEKSE